VCCARLSAMKIRFYTHISPVVGSQARRGRARFARVAGRGDITGMLSTYARSHNERRQDASDVDRRSTG
jgi:hypothetical protein